MPKNERTAVEIGQTYNKLTVLEFDHSDKRFRKWYKCVCICGEQKIIMGSAMSSGNTKSCGCYSREAKRLKALPHGEAAMRQVVAGYKHKAKKNGVKFDITNEQFKRIVSQPCFYCGVTDSNLSRSTHGTGDFAYNGLDKIDSDKGYIFNNVVPSCRRCNFAKSNHPQGDFIRWVKQAYDHLAKTAMAEQWG